VNQALMIHSDSFNGLAGVEKDRTNPVTLNRRFDLCEEPQWN